MVGYEPFSHDGLQLLPCTNRPFSITASTSALLLPLDYGIVSELEGCQFDLLLVGVVLAFEYHLDTLLPF